jgi:competence protein ComEA
MPELTKEQLYLILGIIFIILIGCVYGLFQKNQIVTQSSPFDFAQGKPDEGIIIKQPKSEGFIYVHISGAVIRPGLYRVNSQERLAAVLEIAGVDAKADLDSVNLASIVTDGQRIIIPGKGMRGNYVPEKTEGSKIVNINTADEKTLDSLPGIGPSMVKKIVDHRKEKGVFSNIEELKEVPGISEKKFEKLKALITVR